MNSAEVKDGLVHDVTLWHVDLNCPSVVDYGKTVLTNDELLRAERFIFERDRNRYFAGRGALRFLLGRQLGCEPADVDIEHEIYGKPKLSAEYNANLRFNLTHSHDQCIIALGERGEIGVDLEKMEPKDLDEISTQVMTEAELKFYRALDRSLQVEFFFGLWTIKEAILKALGTGLSRDPRSVALSDPEWYLTKNSEPGVVWESLYIKSFRVLDGFQSALANEGNEMGIKIYKFSLESDF